MLAQPSILSGPQLLPTGAVAQGSQPVVAEPSDSVPPANEVDLRPDQGGGDPLLC